MAGNLLEILLDVGSAIVAIEVLECSRSVVGVKSFTVSIFLQHIICCKGNSAK